MGFYSLTETEGSVFSLLLVEHILALRKAIKSIQREIFK